MIMGVPYDAEIEYLESTGTQYIDTGIIANMDYRFDFGIMPLSSNNSVIFGCTNTATGYPGILLNDVGTFRYGTQQVQTTSPALSPNTKHNCVLAYKKLTVDGIEFSATGTTLDTAMVYSIFLFARNNMGDAGTLSRCRVYRYSASVNNVFVRDFIPVRFTNELGNTEGAMYDRVTRKLFRNKGTGSFTLGPDVARPLIGLHVHKPHYTARDYIQDGLVAMWDGEWNIGDGEHDNNATVWKNLAGNSDYDVTLTSRAKFVANAMEITDNGGPAAQGLVALPGNDNNYHYEIVASSESIIQNSAFFIFAGGGSHNNNYANNTIILYAWSQYSRKGFGYGSPSTLYRADTNYSFSGVHQGSGTHDFSAYDGRVLLDTSYVNTEVSKNVQPVVTFSFANSGAVSLNPPVGFRVHTLRIYSSRLSEDARIHNYLVDKARFNLLEVAS